MFAISKIRILSFDPVLCMLMGSSTETFSVLVSSFTHFCSIRNNFFSNTLIFSLSYKMSENLHNSSFEGSLAIKNIFIAFFYEISNNRALGVWFVSKLVQKLKFNFNLATTNPWKTADLCRILQILTASMQCCKCFS